MKNGSEIYAKYNKAHVSPKKVGIVLDLIRGKSLKDAKVTLAFDQTKAAGMILKTVKSAEANAKNNEKLDTDGLYVSSAWVGQGQPRIKKFRAGPRGRAKPIISKTSNIFIGLSERSAN